MAKILIGQEKVNMRFSKNMHEIMQEISSTPEFERRAVIQTYINNSLFKKMVSIIYDPRIEWDLPEGMPPHKRDETIPPDLAFTTLVMELKSLQKFLTDLLLKPKKLKLFRALLLEPSIYQG